MKTEMTKTELLCGAEYLLNQIALCKNELRIICNDGAIHINANTLKFTFLGMFGSKILSKMIDKGVCNKIPEKLILTHLFMDIYSRHCGGFNLELN